jgi:hypothetical protein
MTTRRSPLQATIVDYFHTMVQVLAIYAGQRVI